MNRLLLTAILLGACIEAPASRAAADLRLSDAEASAAGADSARLPGPVEFILGPQVPLGDSPWPWFDQQQVAGAERWHAAYLRRRPGGDDYYDLALALYQLHARSGRAAHLQMAREVALESWRRIPDQTTWTTKPNPFAIAPRSMPIGSLTLLAMEGGAPELTFRHPRRPAYSQSFTLWDYLTEYVRAQYPSWLGHRLGNAHLWSGVRDGGMLLHGVAMLARAHPDAAVREEFTRMARAAALEYYVRLQRPDGSWRWNPGRRGAGNEQVDATQPFMLGLLLEGLIAVHQLTGDATLGDAIVRATEAIYRDMFDRHPVPFELLAGTRVRAVWYYAYGEKCQVPIPPQAGCGNDFEATLTRGVARNRVKTMRHRNALVVHAFGYAYHLTGDPRFREMGDDIFSATYGAAGGPGADGLAGLADANKGKEYNQAYRSAGRYLGWRSH